MHYDNIDGQIEEVEGIAGATTLVMVNLAPEDIAVDLDEAGSKYWCYCLICGIDVVASQHVGHVVTWCIQAEWVRHRELVDAACWGVYCAKGRIVPHEVQDTRVGVGVLHYEKAVAHVDEGPDLVGAAREHDLALAQGSCLVNFDWVAAVAVALDLLHILQPKGPRVVGVVPLVVEGKYKLYWGLTGRETQKLDMTCINIDVPVSICCGQVTAVA